MKVKSEWKNQTSSILYNERGHEILVDLPQNRLGNDEGPTPSEIMIMSLAGSVTTIFSMLALKRGLYIEKLICELETDNRFGYVVPEEINGNLTVFTNNLGQAETIWQMTQKICTTTQILKKAEIPLSINLKLKLLSDKPKVASNYVEVTSTT